VTREIWWRPLSWLFLWVKLVETIVEICTLTYYVPCWYTSLLLWSMDKEWM
jgi:hypothetical protein